jgi:hypothetical protein
MPETLSPVNLGLAEFVSKLVEETSDAILASQYNQLKRNVEFRQGIQLSVEEFANSNVSNSDVWESLFEVFPNVDWKTGSIAPLKDMQFALDRLNIKLDARIDYTPDSKWLDQGIKKIFDRVRLKVAQDNQEILRATAKDGLSKLVIAGGKLTARVSFEASKIEDDTITKIDTPVPQKITTSKNTKEIGKIGTVFISKTNLTNKITTGILPEVRLSVKQASNQSESSNTSIFGEITLEFKTI